ncbi:Uncharacterized protein TCM_004399 [Theobroma cacao]|uniref:Uncharacterized protein n=1 Tax=Theobroma cacao TaxID=3641 RepID=A0A061DQV2_THECC|nr:Uncharacterized protein TCM_004399 [Theobroma cacao]
MAAVVEDIEVGFEEAMSWLPSHVLDEAVWDTKKNRVLNLALFIDDDMKYHSHRHRPKLPTEPFSSHSKASSRRHHKPRNWSNWASGGPGMQAFFLDSGQKSCGTGVFLPQRAGNNFQSSRKPACSPVLLPSRVVQALNLNVHELGLQISPRRDPKNNTRRGDLNSLNNKNGKDVSTKRCVISQNENTSPEIFLPKEWTY